MKWRMKMPRQSWFVLLVCLILLGGLGLNDLRKQRMEPVFLTFAKQYATPQEREQEAIQRLAQATEEFPWASSYTVVVKDDSKGPLLTLVYEPSLQELEFAEFVGFGTVKRCWSNVTHSCIQKVGNTKGDFFEFRHYGGLQILPRNAR